MEWILVAAGVGSASCVLFLIRDLRTMNKKKDEEIVYYCRRCDQINMDEDCPVDGCGEIGSAMTREKAESLLANENVIRMHDWISAGRFIPEVEAD